MQQNEIRFYAFDVDGAEFTIDSWGIMSLERLDSHYDHCKSIS